MATIIKTKAGNFKAIIRVKQQVVKAKTFRLKNMPGSGPTGSRVTRI